LYVLSTDYIVPLHINNKLLHGASKNGHYPNATARFTVYIVDLNVNVPNVPSTISVLIAQQVKLRVVLNR